MYLISNIIVCNTTKLVPPCEPIYLQLRLVAVNIRNVYLSLFLVVSQIFLEDFRNVNSSQNDTCQIHKTKEGCHMFNTSVPSAPFLYSQKTSENLKAFWRFQGIEKGCIGNKCVKCFSFNVSSNDAMP